MPGNLAVVADKRPRHMPGAGLVTALLVWLAGTAAPATAQQGAPAAVPPIADNSFLLEEAYNQEPGVVQHISTFLRFGAEDWAYSFTQEWPVSGQRHQFSLTVPLQQAGGGAGVGDLALNYRLQALDASRGPVAFSPRLSLLVPTGSAARGRGAGGPGLQANLPLSVAAGRRFVTHSNLGVTWTPGAENAQGDEADATGLNAGQSAIWLARPTVNVMLELVWARSHEVTGPGRTVRRDSLHLSPGVRWAHNFASGLQIVPGLALPIGLGPSRGDDGWFLYLSFEHPFGRGR
jgi:hypothetical protein